LSAKADLERDKGDDSGPSVGSANTANFRHHDPAAEHSSFVAQLQKALNAIPAYTWYAVPGGALTFVDDYLGLPKDHPLRLGIDTGAAWDSHIPLLHPDDRDETRRVWSNCLRTGSAGEVSFRVRNAQEAYRWFIGRAEPLRASDGSLLFWIGINLDIDDRKKAEERAQEEHERLRQLESDLAHMNRLHIMGEQAASLAHEVTQPIAAARNNARAALNFLDKQPPDLGEVREALDCVVSAADRSGEIIERIRDHIKKAPPRKTRLISMTRSMR
jgi:signal transduction histidine kinase